jgi:hypothetical protein
VGAAAAKKWGSRPAGNGKDLGFFCHPTVAPDPEPKNLREYVNYANKISQKSSLHKIKEKVM